MRLESSNTIQPAGRKDPRTTTRFFLTLAAIAQFFCFSSLAQVDSVYYGKNPTTTKTKPPKQPVNDAWKEKVSWGGNLQAWLGNPTFILLSPTIGYIPLKNFNVGIGGIYNYTSYRSSYGDYSQSIFGAHSFARYTIADSYFLQFQFDRLYQPDLFSLEPNDRIWVNYFLVGGGFRQPIGDKAALTTSIMYNVNPSPLSIYPSRIIIQFGVIGTF
jgi:hypothetical protein